ncbi:DUF2064 domain-containing protein [Haloferacaceae archaeon DSL9]
MTVLAVMAAPPRDGLVLPKLAETSPLTERDATALYTAMLRDTFLAATRSGGDLLVNYQPTELLSEAHRADTDPGAELRALAAKTLDDVGEVRFEPQVGSTFAARAGNAVTHLLREEGAQSVAITRGTAPMLVRTVIDTAAMKLRTNEVVLGPATKGRTYYAGFTAPIDFDGAFAPPEIETLAERARDADRSTEFLPMTPVVEDGADLATLVSVLRSRFTAERIVPEHTAAFIHERGLQVDSDGALTLDSDR